MFERFLVCLRSRAAARGSPRPRRRRSDDVARPGGRSELRGRALPRATPRSSAGRSGRPGRVRVPGARRTARLLRLRLARASSSPPTPGAVRPARSRGDAPRAGHGRGPRGPGAPSRCSMTRSSSTSPRRPSRAASTRSGARCGRRSSGSRRSASATGGRCSWAVRTSSRTWRSPTSTSTGRSWGSSACRRRASRRGPASPESSRPLRRCGPGGVWPHVGVGRATVELPDARSVVGLHRQASGATVAATPLRASSSRTKPDAFSSSTRAATAATASGSSARGGRPTAGSP